MIQARIQFKLILIFLSIILIVVACKSIENPDSMEATNSFNNTNISSNQTNATNTNNPTSAITNLPVSQPFLDSNLIINEYLPANSFVGALPLSLKYLSPSNITGILIQAYTSNFTKNYYLPPTNVGYLSANIPTNELQPGPCSVTLTISNVFTNAWRTNLFFIIRQSNSHVQGECPIYNLPGNVSNILCTSFFPYGYTTGLILISQSNSGFTDSYPISSTINDKSFSLYLTLSNSGDYLAWISFSGSNGAYSNSGPYGFYISPGNSIPHYLYVSNSVKLQAGLTNSVSAGQKCYADLFNVPTDGGCQVFYRIVNPHVISHSDELTFLRYPISLVGSSPEYIELFTALSPGLTAVTVSAYRIWEGPSQAAFSNTYYVQVQ